VSAWVAIRNQDDPEPVTVEVFRSSLLRQTGSARRFVAEVDRQVVGYAATILHPLWPDRLMVGVKVNPPNRRHGIGGSLLQTIDSAVFESDATFMQAPVRDNDPESRGWAEKRGFTFHEHRFQSSLRLTNNQYPPMSDSVHIERVGASDRVYSLFSTLIRDAPDEATAPDRDWFDHHLMERSAVFVVIDNDQWAGLTILQVRSKENAYNFFTGVVPQARGRGFARSLKLAAIAEARSRGIATITTDNSSTNAAMLAVNRRLGYVPHPGHWLLRRPTARVRPSP
jgi:GNAT superfamily N-acetyltransferase